MAEHMQMPKTAEAFIEQYKFTDSKREYTNGSELISVFRVQQMIEHYFATDNHVAVKTECEYCQQFDDPCGVPMIAAEDSDPDRGIYLYNGFLCASGGEFCEAKVNFCPMCGRKLPEPPKGE